MMITALSFVDWLLATGAILCLLYVYANWTYDFFKKHNITYPKTIPLFGNYIKMMSKMPFPIMIQEIYSLFPDKKFIGCFEFRRPQILLQDPELIKQITIKDFEYFQDHRFVIDENVDPLFGKNLVMLRGERWKGMRVTLSPAFTGSKMKVMYSLINDCAIQVVDYIKNESKTGTTVLELKELFGRFGTDVIATSAFGVKSDSFTNKNNEFYKMSRSITTLNIKQTIKFLGYTSFPNIMKYFKLTLFDEIPSKFFRSLIKETLMIREQKNIHRPDLIHLMMQARKGTLKTEIQEDHIAGYAAAQQHLLDDNKDVPKRELTDDDITAQALIFFLAGFDTASTLMCFTAYELAINEEIQLKLQNEIDEIKKRTETVTYETIHSLKYLDMVISESLRKWPPAPVTDRCCVKPYTFYDGETSIKVLPGVALLIPIYALHRDPAHFPNPDTFDPERFSDQNKQNIKAGSYLPFGSGPRNCIGSRFAIMEAKAIIFHLLANFDFKICAKTQIPLKLSKSVFVLGAEKGFWIDIKPRIF